MRRWRATRHARPEIRPRRARPWQVAHPPDASPTDATQYGAACQAMQVWAGVRARAVRGARAAPAAGERAFNALARAKRRDVAEDRWTRIGRLGGFWPRLDRGLQRIGTTKPFDEYGHDLPVAVILLLGKPSPPSLSVSVELGTTGNGLLASHGCSVPRGGGSAPALLRRSPAATARLGSCPPPVAAGAGRREDPGAVGLQILHAHDARIRDDRLARCKHGVIVGLDDRTSDRPVVQSGRTFGRDQLVGMREVRVAQPRSDRQRITRRREQERPARRISLQRRQAGLFELVEVEVHPEAAVRDANRRLKVGPEREPTQITYGGRPRASRPGGRAGRHCDAACRAQHRGESGDSSMTHNTHRQRPQDTPQLPNECASETERSGGEESDIS
jgi:hypothetical protein